MRFFTILLFFFLTSSFFSLSIFSAGAAGEIGLVKPWVKSCLREGDVRVICLTSQNFFLNDGKNLAFVGVKIDSSTDKMLLIARVPVGIRIRPGVKVVIMERVIKLEYEVCVSNICEASSEIDNEFIKAMSAAKNMDLVYVVFNGQRIRASMKMDSFGSVYNGQPQRIHNSVVTKRGIK